MFSVIVWKRKYPRDTTSPSATSSHYMQLMTWCNTCYCLFSTPIITACLSEHESSLTRNMSCSQENLAQISSLSQKRRGRGSSDPCILLSILWRLCATCWDAPCQLMPTVGPLGVWESPWLEWRMEKMCWCLTSTARRNWCRYILCLLWVYVLFSGLLRNYQQQCKYVNVYDGQKDLGSIVVFTLL